MIVSKNIEINVSFPITNSQIEMFFESRNLKVLRWSIIGINDKSCTIRASIEE